MLCDDLIQYISEYTDLYTALNIAITCKWMADNLKIKYIDTYQYENYFKLNDRVLQQKKYSDLIKLVINNNRNISDLNHLKKLQELDIRGLDCNVNDKHIQNLNLKIFKACGNSGIKIVKHMTNLEQLYIGGLCGVNNQSDNQYDNQIESLPNLIVLNIAYNHKINNLTYSSN